MPESLWCFLPNDRLLTMADNGEARIWTVTGDGWLVLSQGRPRQEEQPPPLPTGVHAAEPEPEKKEES